MATVTGSSTHAVNFSQSGPATIPGSVSLSAAESVNNKYSAGTSASQGDLLHTLVYTLGVSTPQTIDLTSLTDMFGGAINFARVRSVTFVSKTTTAGAKIAIGAAASNQWVGPIGTTTGTLILPAGGSMFFEDPLSTGGTAGWFVSGTSKLLKFDPGTTAQTLEIVLFGSSVA